jgi:DNA polymerase-3 subunit beta
MRLVVTAGALATAIDFVSDVLATKAHVELFQGARLGANSDTVTIGATDLNQYATAIVDAAVEEPGVVVLSAAALAGIAQNFDRNAALTITASARAATIQCGRSRYRPPLWPITDFPPPLTIDVPKCSVTLGRYELFNLFGRTAFAASTEPTRSYLNGMYLHEAGGALTGVATDGRRLARNALPMPECAGKWPTAGIIVPNKAVAIINKLVKTTDSIELIVGAPARASVPATLITARTGGRSLTSKLIDGTFPNYGQLIPAPSSDSALIDRADLVGAVRRAAAVSVDQGLCLGLIWANGDTSVQLCLTRAVDAVIDEVRAETHGAARVALSARLLLEQLDEIVGKIVRLDPGNHPTTPVLITDPTDTTFLSLLMRMAWLAPSAEPVRKQAHR